MIRQFFIFTCFVVFPSSFSFWKMKGPYIIDAEPNENSINHCYSINKENVSDNDLPFLYDKHTGYCFMANIKDSNFIKNHCYDFLKGQFKYNENFWDRENLQTYIGLYYYKTNLKIQDNQTFKEEDIQAFKNSFNFELNCDRGNIHKYEFLSTNYNDPNNEWAERSLPWRDGVPPYNIAAIKLQKTFDSVIGVNIEHWDETASNNEEDSLIKKVNIVTGVQIQNLEEGVTLTQNNKSIDLQEALKKYFLNSGTAKFVSSLAKDDLPKVYEKVTDKNEKPSLSATTVADITKINHPKLDQESIKLLHECKILALWYLIPEEIDIINKEGKTEKKKVHFKLLGLAEDKDGHKFHWITDLNNEISVLMQYAR